MKCKKINRITFIEIVIILLIILVIIKNCLSFKNTPTTPPVESSKIDPITKDNDKLIIDIKRLDSIKNDKSIEVKNLDNDSTLKLFYQLIGK